MKNTPVAAAAFGLAVVAAILTACNGDTPASGGYPVASPPPPGRSSFYTALKSRRVPLPPTAGFTGGLSIPSATIRTKVGLFAGISPPFGTPIMQGATSGDGLAPIPLLYIAMTAGTDVQLRASPGFALTLPRILGTKGFKFYVGYFNPKKPLWGYQTEFEGPAAVSGQNIRFSERTTAFDLYARETTCFAIYEVPIPTPSPSPTPS